MQKDQYMNQFVNLLKMRSLNLSGLGYLNQNNQLNRKLWKVRLSKIQNKKFMKRYFKKQAYQIS